MAKLRLGIGAKAMILLSRMHPKNLISKAYPNQTKADKVEGLIVVSDRFAVRKRLLLSFVIPRKTNRQRNSNVGRCIGSFMLLKKGTKQDCFPQKMVGVRTILEQQKLPIGTSTSRTLLKIPKKIKKMCHQRWHGLWIQKPQE